MFESQHLQPIWFTGLAAHPQPTARTPRAGADPEAAPEPRPRPALPRILAALAGRAAAWRRRPQAQPEAAPSCCPAPGCC